MAGTCQLRVLAVGLALLVVAAPRQVRAAEKKLLDYQGCDAREWAAGPAAVLRVGGADRVPGPCVTSRADRP